MKKEHIQNQGKDRGIRAIGIIVFLSGAIYILPIITLLSSLYRGGVYERVDGVIVEKVIEAAPAAQAGILANDRIVKVNGNITNNAKTFADFINNNLGKKLTFEVSRDGVVISTLITPRENYPPNEGALGVTITDTHFVRYGIPALFATIFQRYYFGDGRESVDQQETRIFIFVSSIVKVVLGIGLYLQKRLAYYGYIVVFSFGVFTLLLNRSYFMEHWLGNNYLLYLGNIIVVVISIAYLTFKRRYLH